MNLNKLYKLQEELDKHILEKHNIKMSKEELLDNIVLALLVEVGELANTTRCFKHWSTKGMMDKEVVIEELSDVWHFYLSIGNQMGINLNNYNQIDYSDILININEGMTENFTMLYVLISSMANNVNKKETMTKRYLELGVYLLGVCEVLEFTDKEVEQAYLKKHEENYKRQREGY